ncbi:hypothetical protein PIB30_038847 [Stylosanthes scabra]|nr:hypothetical protein [Stylosanthes scabra]
MIDDDSSLSPVRGSFDACIGDEKDNQTVHAEAIWSALSDMASSSQRGAGQSGGWSSEDEAEAMDQDGDGSERERSLRFKEHRKAHYDEFLKVRELRQKGLLEEEEKDEDNGSVVCKKGEDESEASSSLSDGVKEIHIEGKEKVFNAFS